jgi:CubicO group peptidase (beta-lactamase class C family)
MNRPALTLAALLLLPSLLLGQRAVAGHANPSVTRDVLSAADASALDSLFGRAYPDTGPGATVLIARGETVLYRKAFGMADLELRVPMRPDHVLQLASITKQFTSVAVLLLVEQGKLALTDPLSKFLAGFPRGDEITVHHLLTHSSGLPSYTNLPALRSRTREDLTPEQIVAFFRELPLEFTPGERYAYSNSGYLLLGMLIEQLSGMSYGDFVRSHIFERLGMRQSYYASNYVLIPERASGYQVYEGAYENPEYLSPTIAYAAGALLSTVDDMLRWHRALRDHRLMSEHSTRLAFTNHRLTNGRFGNYGYGWAINEIAGVPTLEHTGGINGFATAGIAVPSRDLYAIVLTNRDDGIGPEATTVRAVSHLLGAPMAEQAPVSLSEAQLTRWVGTYRFEDAVRVVTFEDGSLFSAREGGRPFRLVPTSDHTFRVEDRFATYEFSIIDGQRRARYTDRIIKSEGTATDATPPATSGNAGG